MSIKYADSNSDSAIDGFYKRFMYQFKIVDAAATYKNVVNFQAEKYLYGRVDRRYVPIVLSTYDTQYKYFPDGAGHTTTFLAPSFVVDAFNDLKLQFQKGLLTNKIHSEDPYLTAPRIYKAYENPKLLYGEYLEGMMATIKAAVMTNNIKFKDFDEFLPHFMLAIEAATKASAPYTYPAFVKNKICPISTTGLALEIADLSCANDDEKIKQFIKSKNWHFYLNACRSYGFSVDMLAPWRLVADIGSSTMLRYARKYGYASTSGILLSAYRYAHSEYYYDGFKRALLAAYDEIRPLSYVETKQCESGIRNMAIIESKQYSVESLTKLYGETYFLKLYLQIRLFEEKPKLTKAEKNRLIDDTIDYHRAGNTRKALMAFERIIGKTYNYSGSLTNLEESAKLRAEEKFQKEELRGAVSTYR